MFALKTIRLKNDHFTQIHLKDTKNSYLRIPFQQPTQKVLPLHTNILKIILDPILGVKIILRQFRDMVCLLLVDLGPVLYFWEPENGAHQLELVLHVFPGHERLPPVD